MSRYQYNEAATVPAINAELEKIQEAIEDSLSRSGDTPNTMTAPLDMNGERIMNLPAAVSDSEPMRKGEAQSFVDAAEAAAAEALVSEQEAAVSASEASAFAASASADADTADDLIQQLNSIYLGAYSTGPVTDNEGNPLQQGALYYNTVSKNLLVFNGTSWVISASQESAAAAELSAVNAATSAAAALVSKQAAEAAETLAEQHKDAAFVSASSASGSANSASSSATASAVSETNSGLSAIAAQTSAIEASNSASAASDSEDAAAVSETNAAGSATAAATSATSASNSASAASTSASNAAGSATAAATSETNAASSATSAASSATSASTSATTALQYLEETETARDEVLQYSTAVSKGLVFIGLYDASTGVYPTLPVDIVGNPFWIISTGGTVSGTVLNPGDSLIYDVTNEVFIKLDTVDQVVSVAGKTGAVSLDKADVGLANVDNTSDLNKPISTATQTALDGKANTSHTHVISDVTGLQSALDAKVDDSQLATAATNNSVAQRDATGQLIATNLITADKIIHDGDTDTAVRFPAADTVTVETNGAERLRVTSAGDMGMGTAAPRSYANLKTLTINGTNGSVIDFEAGGVHTGEFFSNATSFDFAFKNNTDLVFYGNATERMRITNSGNVGIGTASPAQKLTMADAGNNFISQIAGGSSLCGLLMGTSADTVDGQVTYNNATQSLGFVTNSAERMRIDSSGNLIFGSTTPLGPESFTIYAGGPIITRKANAAGYLARRDGTNGSVIDFYKSSTVVGSISVTTSATSYNTSSDYRLKEDWQPMDCACDRVMQLNPVNFAWKSNGQRVDGFLAHELEDVIPEAVTGEKDETKIEEYEVEPAVYEDVVIPAEFDEEGNEVTPERTEQRLVSEAVMGEREVPVYQGIDQSKLTPLLTAALQEALRKIEALEARIEALEQTTE